MIKLQRGQLLRMLDGAGTTVTAHSGALWITEQDSPRDVMLRAGERHRLGQAGLTLLEALSDASLSFDP